MSALKAIDEELREIAAQRKDLDQRARRLERARALLDDGAVRTAAPRVRDAQRPKPETLGKVLAALKGAGPKTRKDVAWETDVGLSTAGFALTALVEDGLVERNGKQPYRYSVIPEEVPPRATVIEPGEGVREGRLLGAGEIPTGRDTNDHGGALGRVSAQRQTMRED